MDKSSAGSYGVRLSPKLTLSQPTDNMTRKVSTHPTNLPFVSQFRRFQFIHGYIALSLKGVDLTQEAKPGDDSSMSILCDADEIVNAMTGNPSWQECEWSNHLTFMPDDEPVFVVGVMYDMGDQPPPIPTKLSEFFKHQLPVQMELTLGPLGPR